jgi:cell division protein FtsB
MFLYNFVKKHNVSKRIFISYFVGFSIILYFVFCTIFGQKGLVEYFSLKFKISEREIVKKELLSKMRVKQNKVDSMNLNSLDIDLLDEQARKVLGYSGKNEVVVYQDKKSSTNNESENESDIVKE